MINSLFFAAFHPSSGKLAYESGVLCSVDVEHILVTGQSDINPSLPISQRTVPILAHHESMRTVWSTTTDARHIRSVPTLLSRFHLHIYGQLWDISSQTTALAPQPQPR